MSENYTNNANIEQEDNIEKVKSYLLEYFSPNSAKNDSNGDNNQISSSQNDIKSSKKDDSRKNNVMLNKEESCCTKCSDNFNTSKEMSQPNIRTEIRGFEFNQERTQESNIAMFPMNCNSNYSYNHQMSGSYPTQVPNINQTKPNTSPNNPNYPNFLNSMPIPNFRNNNINNLNNFSGCNNPFLNNNNPFMNNSNMHNNMNNNMNNMNNFNNMAYYNNMQNQYIAYNNLKMNQNMMLRTQPVRNNIMSNLSNFAPNNSPRIYPFINPVMNPNYNRNIAGNNNSNNSSKNNSYKDINTDGNNNNQDNNCSTSTPDFSNNNQFNVDNDCFATRNTAPNTATNTTTNVTSSNTNISSNNIPFHCQNQVMNKKSSPTQSSLTIISNSSDNTNQSQNTSKFNSLNNLNNNLFNINNINNNSLSLGLNNYPRTDYSIKPKQLILDKKFFQPPPVDNTDIEEPENLEEIIKNINCPLHEFICTQQGSRILQKLLNKISPENLDSILFKLSGFFKELMTDIYGNYFSQKLFQCCTSEQRILSDFVYIACHNSGTHSIQSLVELVNMPDEESIVKESITDNIMQLSFDVNGTHVMQKILASIKEDNRENINIIILDNLDKLVLDNNGVCVIKKFITRNKNENIRSQIEIIILKNCIEILQNPFGNYIIQHILETWSLENSKGILKIILDNVGSLSMQKFSSNVVERCLGIVEPEFRKKLIKELFNVTKIASLIKNKFGMFVLQKAIESMRCEEKIEIKEYLIKKLGVTSKQEKGRLNALIDLLNCPDNII